VNLGCCPCDQSHGLQFVAKRMLNCDADQALSSGNRNRLDATAPESMRTFFLPLFSISSLRNWISLAHSAVPACGPLDTGVNNLPYFRGRSRYPSFRDVQSPGRACQRSSGRGRSRSKGRGLGGRVTSEKRMPPPTGVVRGPLMANAELADGFDRNRQEASCQIWLWLFSPAKTSNHATLAAPVHKLFYSQPNAASNTR